MVPGPEAPVPELPGGASPPAASTSRFAIASLVTGVLAIVPLSVVFGIAALLRIPRRGQRGKALAVVGLLLSALWVTGGAAGFLIAELTGVERDSGGRVTEPTAISVFDVRPGDCLESIEADAETSTVDAVPCSERHMAEALSSFSLPEGDYPGDDAVFAAGDQRCPQALAERVRPAERAGVEEFYLYPTQRSWEQQDDRKIVCIALSNGARTGSVM